MLYYTRNIVVLVARSITVAVIINVGLLNTPSPDIYAINLGIHLGVALP